MTRDDFLRELRIALQGRIPQGQVNEQLRYYENYIIEESRKGRTQDEVLEELGNPRLIAKTIIDTFGDGMNYEGQTPEPKKREKKAPRPHSWYERLLSAIVFVILLVLLVKIGIILLPILAAAFMVGAIIYIFFQIFFGNKK